jgi:hypothetical protein
MRNHVVKNSFHFLASYRKTKKKVWKSGPSQINVWPFWKLHRLHWGLLAPFYHCWWPGGGGVFLPSHNKIHDTHTLQGSTNLSHKKTSIFFFAFLVLSDKLGKPSLRFRTALITFFFYITVFLYQDKNPVDHMIHWRQLLCFPDHCAS